MNYAGLMGGLTNFSDWIETNVINGFMSSGFTLIRDFLISFLQFKPLFDLIFAIFSLGR